ncbi:hypothetical protein ACL9RI_16205 [Janthinobacterium sp. Mn2066]|uniref:hypothetical protein n=1 Tax=Janthinobacterium sp. Mn2066 TaxID=3395264 RepID=UPI003BEA3B40
MINSTKNKKELHAWLKKYFKKINEKLVEPPRLLGETSKYNAQQEEFEQLAQMLISRMFKAMLHPKEIKFSLVVNEISNAWAIWPADFYAVLVTTALAKNIQETCGQVETLMRQGERLPTGEPNLMRDLWSGMPYENRDYESFGGLLAHIAYAFVVHHELAHIGLGHEAILGGILSSNANSIIEEEVLALDESRMCAPAAQNADGSPSLSGQALEADADLNALAYTIEFMQLQQRKFLEKEVCFDDSQGIVWKDILTNKNKRWFAITAGVAVGLFCLINNFESEKIDALDARSHPPISARVMVMLHAIKIRYLNENPGAPFNLPDTLLFVVTLFGNLHMAKTRKAISIDELIEKFLIKEAVEKFEEIGMHYEKLSTEMKLLDNKRRHLVRFEEYLCWQWYNGKAAGI